MRDEGGEERGGEERRGEEDAVGEREKERYIYT